jgi:zinc/manganese transport system permease protein
VNTEALDAGILAPAFLAGLVVLSTHVPLGRRVLERGIIFIDLAIAQIAGLGVIAAHVFADAAGGLVEQAAAFGAAVIGAGLLYWTERRWPKEQEAIIGSLFVLAASSAILLLAQDPRAGEHLKDLLVGQILWVDSADVWPAALISVAVIVAWFGFGASERVGAFYALFAVAVTASVQLVGVYLVFASLIMPALGTRGLPPRSRLPAAFGVGALGYGGGLVVSALLDLPAGPVIVCMLAACALLAATVGSRHGV